MTLDHEVGSRNWMGNLDHEVASFDQSIDQSTAKVSIPGNPVCFWYYTVLYCTVPYRLNTNSIPLRPLDMDMDMDMDMDSTLLNNPYLT